MQGKPVSKIVGKKNFWKYNFLVNEYTLDPRPETELLIEIVLDYLKKKQKDIQILDLGSGSGCIGLSLLKELPFSYLFCLSHIGTTVQGYIHSFVLYTINQIIFYDTFYVTVPFCSNIV